LEFAAVFEAFTCLAIGMGVGFAILT
jgi:hypothetical protein